MRKVNIPALTSLLLLASFPLFFFHCKRAAEGELETALKQAANNRAELEKVIAHFEQHGSEREKQSAHFLVTHMGRQGSINLLNGKLTPDLQVLNAAYLIHYIRSACTATQKFDRFEKISFADFSEYVLPHRRATEPISNWRDSCTAWYGRISSGVTSSLSGITIANRINSELIREFRFDPAAAPANLRTWQDMMAHPEGDCWVMAARALFPLRAMGIPTTIDYVPFWSNANGGAHAWNALLLSPGKPIPMMGSEVNIPDYDPFLNYVEKHWAAKVFRQTFSIQENSLPFVIDDARNMPSQLSRTNLVDITAQYLPTRNILVTLAGESGQKVIYLSVYSNGNWEPVYWAAEDNGHYLFRNMGLRALYLPSAYNQSRTLPLGDPFFISGNNIISLRPRLDQKIRVAIPNTEPKIVTESNLHKQFDERSEIVAAAHAMQFRQVYSAPATDSTYSLFFWKKQGWRLAGNQKKRIGAKLVFPNVPPNAVYKLCMGECTGKERPFTLDKGEQVWW